MSCQSSRLLHSKLKPAARILQSPPPPPPFLLLLFSYLAFSAVATTWGLSPDGVLLLQFKYSVLADPLGALSDWNYEAASPCAWNGVLCMAIPDAAAPLDWTIKGGADAVESSTSSRVIGLVLPNSRLLGSIPVELGLLEHLRHLDLSGNVLNGTLPASLFNASELRILALADNEISGELPEPSLNMSNLQVLNLSGNALVGGLPANLSLLPNLTIVSLANNYLDGELNAGGFDRLEFLDLSSNLINGSLPPDFGGERLRFLNLSYNLLSGEIPPDLGLIISANATVDLSFNNLTGEVPETGAFAGQKATAFVGNPDLCGRPPKNLCTIPSSLSNPPNASTTALEGPESPPAFAAIPKNTEGTSPAGVGQGVTGQRGLRPAVIIAITIGDLAGIGILFLVFLYVYHVKKRRRQRQEQAKQEQQMKKQVKSIDLPKEFAPPASPESRGAIAGLSCCFREKSGDGDDTEDTSETSSSSSGAEAEETGVQMTGKETALAADGKSHTKQKQQGSTLVTVDGDRELELETLLKASAYILGASGSSIVYKAVLADGTALAVRRIGESSVSDKLKDFDAQVRIIAKFRHPNLLRLRGYYWGPDEKLVIHDFASNGSLANISLSKKIGGSSPFNLSWETRLRIARGLARGLAYLHEKKSMHGNIKPSNILIDADMDAKIADFGVDRLISGEGGYKLGTSSRQFGSKRSMHSTNSLPDLSPATGASPCGSSTSVAAPPPYQAPESLKNLKPNAKWDAYAFGMVLLELIAGRVFSEVELCQWNAGFVAEDRGRILRMADPAIRGEVEGKEEAVLGCFRLGFACCAAAPQKRPSMKDAVQLLEKMPLAGSFSSSSSA